MVYENHWLDPRFQRTVTSKIDCFALQDIDSGCFSIRTKTIWRPNCFEEKLLRNLYKIFIKLSAETLRFKQRKIDIPFFLYCRWNSVSKEVTQNFYYEHCCNNIRTFSSNFFRQSVKWPFFSQHRSVRQCYKIWISSLVDGQISNPIWLSFGKICLKCKLAIIRKLELDWTGVLNFSPETAPAPGHCRVNKKIWF